MSKQQSVGPGSCLGLISIVAAALSSTGCGAQGPDGANERFSSTKSALSRDDASTMDDARSGAIAAKMYFVGLKKSARLAESGAAVAEVGSNLQGKHGGRVHRVYKRAVQALAMELSASQVETLKADAEVAYVEPVPVRTLAATQNNPGSWGLDRIDQRQLPRDYQYTYPDAGANIVHVYVLDTGAYAEHSAFGGRVTGGWDFIEDTSDTRERAFDGHGTHVAGIIGSSTWGVAKQVQIHPLRVCGFRGTRLCDPIAEIDAIEWMTQSAQRPAVANMSFFGPKSQTETDAINAAIAHGITVVACAGNTGQDACSESPGSIPGVISVASADVTNTRASDSSHGPCVDLFAPGVDIVSTGVTQDSSATMSGTSMAAPHVTGVAALYLALNPKATPGEVAAAILAQATPGIVVDPQPGSPNLMLYEGFMNAGPCDGLCSSPTNFNFPFNGNYQSGNLGRGNVCRATTSPVTGGNCGNFANGRTLKINGVTKTCNNQNWWTLPASRNGGYCIQTTSGDYSYAYFTLWSSL